MKRIFNGCGSYRESLCLLAGGVLPDQDAVELEAHLATCAGCRIYRDEVKAIAGPLAIWENAFSQIEPDRALQSRWARDFQAALAPVPATRRPLFGSFLEWCREVLWPCRRALAGFAAVWLGILVLNHSSRTQPPAYAGNSRAPSPEAVMAFLEREGLFAGVVKKDQNHRKKPQKPATPGPRSQKRMEVLPA